MSLARYAKKRDENEPALVALARKLGARLWQLDRPCDWVFLHRKTWGLAEIKMPGAPFTDDQTEFLEEVADLGGYVHIWRNESDVMASLGAT